MIRVAFIKFGGMSAGGTEKYLQTVAANLPSERFSVDFYYCDAAPYIGSDYKHLDTDPERLKFMQGSKVNLIKFKVGFKDVTVPTHDWVNTNFWEVFSEEKYDVIFTGRAGHPEYPFCLIKKTPIVDSLHLSGGADNQKNIQKVIQLSEWSARKWIRMGGDRRRITIIYQPVEIQEFKKEDWRKRYGLGNKYVYGFHQRNDDSIFSPIPLSAYATIETDATHFVILNGSEKYKKQAKELGIKNITFLPFAQTQADIYNFLGMLNVFAHGRRDGEINSTSIAEAMAFGLPVVSHCTRYNNGHIETIGRAGKVVGNMKEYAEELVRLQNDTAYSTLVSEYAKKRFEEKYSLERQMQKIEKVIEMAVYSPQNYTFWHWSSLPRVLYSIKYAVRVKLAKPVKYILKKIGL